MSPSEREAIALAISVGAINDLLNHLLLHFTPVSNAPGEMEVRFHNSVHRDLFLVRLQDFLSEKGSEDVLGTNLTCLESLQVAARERNLATEGADDQFQESAQALTDWISTVVRPKLWLPTIGVSATLTSTRADLLRISGNQAKHNPARLSRIAKMASSLLSNQGIVVPVHQVPFVMNDLRDHLRDNFFIYYASWIAELLNNVRWQIQRYLEPLYHRSILIEDGDLPRYSYVYPVEITSESARLWFWELMNQIRSRPYIQPFKASRFLREQSSLEWET